MYSIVINLWNEFALENANTYVLFPVWNAGTKRIEYVWDFQTDFFCDEEVDIIPMSASNALQALNSLLNSHPSIKREFEAFLASRE